MSRLLPRAHFARIAGVSGPAITKACREGNTLHPACLADRIDIDHPAAKKYLAAKGKQVPGSVAAPTSAPKSIQSEPAAPTNSPKQRRNSPAKPTEPGRQPPDPSDPQVEPGSNEDLRSLGESLQPLVNRFGTTPQFTEWLDSLKTIELIREKRLKNEETEGSLIQRDLVATHVFGLIEGGNRRLLSDSPKTIARQLFALAKSGATIEEAEQFVRDNLSSQLKPVKAQVVKAIKQ